MLAATGLAVDAYVHANLAERYGTVTTGVVSEGTLFRIEAGMAALAALLVLVMHRLLTDLYAWLVAVGGLALLLLYRYVDVGAWGPIPNMYEPVWYPDKWLSIAGQALAILTMTGLFIQASGHRRSRP